MDGFVSCVHTNHILCVCVQLVTLDAEGRSVITEHFVCDDNHKDRSLIVINVYCPMVDSSAEDQTRMDYKLKFYAALENRCRAIEKEGK